MRTLLTGTLLLVLAALLVPGTVSAVAGGKPVQSGSSPWMVALVDTAITPSAGCTSSGGSATFCRQFCGATLIAPSWVATAAHCMLNRDPATVRAAIGLEDLNDPLADGRLVPIAGVHYHPLAPLGERTVYRNDIALLQLVTPQTGTVASIAETGELDAILLASPSLEDEVGVLGWGRLGEGGGFPNHLQRVGLDLMPLYCASQYAALSGGGWNPDIWLCAGEPSAGEIEADDWRDVSPRDPTGEDACVLDSGGPLMLSRSGHPTIAGVVSWGQLGECGNPVYPSVYTRLPAYASWIEAVGSQSGLLLTDLAVSITAPASLSPGTLRSFSVKLANQSKVTSVPGAGFDITNSSGTLTLATSPGLLCTAIANGYHCAFQQAAMAAGASVEAVFNVQATSESVVELAASTFRAAGLQDYRTGNDVARHLVTYSDQPDLRIRIDGVPTEISGTDGSAWVYITASNASSLASATGVVVQVQLPAGHTLVDGGTLGCLGTTTLTCSLGTLPPGYSNTWRLALSAAPYADGSVTVSIAGSNGDFPAVRDTRTDTTDTQPVVYRTEAGPNTAPTATACCAQDAAVGNTVTLTGEYQDDRQVTRVEWTQVSGLPSVTLAVVNESETRSTASFTAPYVADARDLQFRLSVWDLQGAQAVATVTVRLNPPAGNVPPTADAGANRSVASGDMVELNGTGTDVDGTIASSLWTQVDGALTPTLYLQGNKALFQAPDVAVATNLVFRLRVTDNEGATGTSDVLLTVLPPPAGNVSPTVNAGPDRAGPSGSSIVLAGTASDGDGTISAVRWRQLSGPSVMLAGSTSRTATFTAPAVGAETVAVFALTARDSAGAYVTDTVNVVIQPAAAGGGNGGKKGGALEITGLLMLGLLGLRTRPRRRRNNTR